MMLNRRLFLAGGCCAAHSMFNLEKSAFAQQNSVKESAGPFVCATIDTVSQTSPQLVIVPAGSGSETINFESNLKALNFTPYGVAMAKDRWLQTDGLTPNTGQITLGVFFMGGTSSQQQIFKNAVVEWTNGVLRNRLRIEFVDDINRSQIRVDFNPNEGNWSYIGRSNKNIRLNAKTMNIADVIPHICQHEFGHAWCLQHEHQIPGDEIRFNDQAVIQDMQQVGWPEATTRSNILTKLNKNALCIGDPKFNPDSLMLYPIKPGWAQIRTSTGWAEFSTPGGTRISSGDIACLKGLYNI